MTLKFDSPIVPMMAKLSKMPSNDRDYAYEIKWDGIRALYFANRGHVYLQSRNLLPLTPQYLELEQLADTIRTRQLILDGEIVTLDESGVPRFERLQNRMNLGSDQVKTKSIPAVTYMIFDLLNLDGEWLIERPYIERRKQLESLGLNGPLWQTPGFHIGDGAALLAATEGKFEGLIAKRIDSKYEPGQRSGAWLKIKNMLRQECVIGGWVPGEGSRSGSIGALLTGFYDLLPEQARRQNTEQKLVYAGKVGTGFSDKTLVNLEKALAPLIRASNPFEVDPPKYRRAVFVEPLLVGEFQFHEWTRRHIMRQPSFKGLRYDKNPREVIREVPSFS